jgi:hypothetical protein
MGKRKAEKLIVDYLEDSAGFLGKRRERLRELNRQYNEIYDKQIREEMDIIRQEVKKKRAEVIESLYENVDELRHLRKYFPELLEVFMDDESIGPILKKKRFLFEDRKHMDEKTAMARLNQIRAKRMELRDAKKFMNNWPGTISAKKLGATYPALKGKFRGDVESAEVIYRIDKMKKELRKDGWKVFINSPLITIPLQKMINDLKVLEVEEYRKQKKCDDAKGTGTNAEYIAQKNLEVVQRRKKHVKKMIKHLLLSNPEFLQELKKNRNWLKKHDMEPLEKFAENITYKKVKEKVWLTEMKKRIS